MPTTKPRKHGLQIARDRILSFIQAQNLHAGSELPALAGLVDMTGLSRGTVWKALQELRSTGAVTGVHGHPFRVGARALDTDDDARAPSPRPADRAAFQTTAWHRVKNRIQKDVLDGAYPPGAALPANKELRRRYSVCFRTLQKALRSLENDGILEPHKKGHRVPAFAARGWKPRVVVLSRSVDESAMVLTSLHDETFFRTLEMHCRVSGIEIDSFLLISEPDLSGYHLKEARTGQEFDLRHFAVRADASILGFVLLAPWLPGVLVHQIAQAIKPLAKPLVVLDGTGKVAGARDLGLDPSKFRSFAPTVSAEAGAAVGRHMLGMGYRETAFISASHDFLWSKNRLEGLLSAYASAGHAHGVHAFTAPGIQETWLVAPPYDTTPIHRAYDAWKPAIPPLYRLDVDQHMAAFDTEVHTTGARQQLYSLFEKALAEKGLRAWVTVNDMTGVMALQFLAHHRVKVPHDIAIVSFDNFSEALKNNLTSFDFNLQAVAAAALGFILGRTPYRETAKIEGYIASRLSTAKA